MKNIFILILISLSIFACKQDKKTVESTTIETALIEPEIIENDTIENNTENQKQVQGTSSHWSYSGKEGPSNWSHLNGAYKDCAGHAQSPINIQTNNLGKNTFEEEDAIRLKLAYSISKAKITNNGHTVQFDIDKGNFIGLGKKRYILEQFHFHSESEHTIDGIRAPMEVQFVNKADDGAYVVIAVLFEEGKSSSFFNRFLQYMPKSPGTIKKEMGFTLKELLPTHQEYFHYKGSLTTPPCSETVDWIVMKNKITATSFQLNELKDLLNNNYRPIQKTNDRKITLNK